ncbi:MAG: hypothetical protein EXS18_05180 [Verrucomicrobiae bacterium]|nr:hypothetical protein [Verrucomicrobiae bacterium]
MMTIACVHVTLHTQSTAADSRVPEAERVALAYLADFYRCDFEKAVRQLHPDTVKKIKETMLATLEKARAAGAEKEVLATLGFENVDELRKMDPSEFHVHILKRDREHNPPGAVEAGKKTTITVKDSSVLDGTNARVVLHLSTPTDGKAFEQDSALKLSKTEGEWKVLGNSP